MPNTRKIIAAGFKNAFYGVLDANGQFIGKTTSLTAGDQDGSGMGRLEGVKVLPITVPDPEIVTATGDDEALAEFTFESADLAGGILETVVKDATFEALCLGIPVRDIDDITTIAVGQPCDPDREDMCLIFQRRAKSYAAGEKGVSRWEGVFIPKCTITPMYSDSFNERAVPAFRYQITLAKTDTLMWGETFGMSLWGTECTAFAQFIADNPVVVQAWRGNGAQTVFNFERTPVSAVKCSVYIAGIKQTITTHYTVDPVAETITFVAAPANNALIHVLHEYTA